MASIGETNVQLGLNASRFTSGLKAAKGEWEGFHGALMKMADFSRFAQGMDFSRFGQGNDIFEGALLASEVAGSFGGPIGAIGQLAESLLNTFGTRSPITEAFGPDKQALIDKIAVATRGAINETEAYAIALKMAGEEGLRLAQHVNKATPEPLSVEVAKGRGIIPKNLDVAWMEKNWPKADFESMAKHWGIDSPGQRDERFRSDRENAIQQQARDKVARDQRIELINKEVDLMAKRLADEEANRDGSALRGQVNDLWARILNEGGQIPQALQAINQVLPEIEAADRLRTLTGGDGRTKFEKMQSDAEFLAQQVRDGKLGKNKFTELMDAQISGLSEPTRDSFRGSTGGLGFNSSAAISAAIDAATRDTPARDRIQEQQLREQRDMRRNLEQIRDNTLRNNPPQLKPANF